MVENTVSNEPNPPIWPASVKIFRDTDNVEWIKKEIEASQDPWSDELNSHTSDKHFSSERTAFLFAPGEYRNLDFEVGYYVQLAGLGTSADDVKFLECEKGPFVPALNMHLHKRLIRSSTSGEDVEEAVGTCLDTFWRSAENFSLRKADLQWAVSQAAPLRRIHVVEGDVYLHDGAAYASGGHLANADIGGKLYAGGQQQYLLRNVHLGKGADCGAWSMVFVGCTGEVPAASGGAEDTAAVTVVDEPRVRVEKPYIAMKADLSSFELRVPRAILRSTPDYTVEPLIHGQHEEARDFSRVRMVRDSDPVNRIQEALDEGKDVVLSPGIYTLEKTIMMDHPGQVLLGLGLATLEAPRDGTPCVKVKPGVPGIRVAGVMLEATEMNASAAKGTKNALFEWGDDKVLDSGQLDDPGAMFDVFVRVGGATAGNRANIAVDSMMKIHSGHVVGDNLWIWRADHAVLGLEEASNYPHISPIFWQSEQHEYRAETGLQVTGDDVTVYGLAVEHADGHQTVWSGERGSVAFYQCEFPYGVTEDFGANEYRGYLVTENVVDHEVFAPGVYSNFRNAPVQVSTAIEHPVTSGVRVVNPFTVKLDNLGGILSVANSKGSAATRKGIPIRLV